jgi:hypothetical protein
MKQARFKERLQARHMTLCKIRDAEIKENIAAKHKTEKHKF